LAVVERDLVREMQAVQSMAPPTQVVAAAVSAGSDSEMAMADRVW